MPQGRDPGWAARAGQTRRRFLGGAGALGTGAAIAGATSGFGTLARAQAAGRRGGTLRIAAPVPDMAHPARYDWPEQGNLARMMLRSLTRIDADNIIRPMLATRWEASDDLKTWTFHLIRGALWSNGDEFGADDVIANVTHWTDPATGSSNLGRFAALTVRGDDGVRRLRPGGIERVDDHTVRFHLHVPFLALPESFADYPAQIVHRDFWVQGGNLVENPIALGPWQLVDYVQADRAVFARRDTAFGPPVFLDQIHIQHMTDARRALAALAGGRVDLLYQTEIDQVAEIDANPDLVLYQTITGQTGVARMRVSEPPFDNPLVRQAIQAAVDRTALLADGYGNLGVAGEDHHVAPVHPEYAPLPALGQNHQVARSLLAEAGYPDGLDVTLDCAATPAWEGAVCRLIAAQLAPAGLRVTVNAMAGTGYYAVWNTTPFGFTSWTHRPLGTQVLSLAYRTGVPWNESGYANADFDALLDQAEATLNVGERRQIMAQLQALLQRDAVIVQPFWRAIHTASRRGVRGFSLQPAREFHLETVWLEA